MTKFTKQELEDLKAAGYVEGNISTFPENVDPALKAKALAQLEEPPAGTELQNEFVRLRAAADGDKEMQKATGVDPLDHDGDGRKGGSAKGDNATARKRTK
jgi:hypothetical protein